MSVYFKGIMGCWTKVSDEFEESEEFVKLEEEAENSGYEIMVENVDGWETASYLIFGKVLATNGGYYGGQVVQLSEFTWFQRSQDELTKIDVALAEFLAKTTVQEVKEVSWSAADVTFITFT